MSDFVESAKNFVNSAVGRASWEAQKQMRVRSKQSEIDKLQEQRTQLLNELAQSAIQLYQQGRLTDPGLSRFCASIMELDHDVSDRNAQLQEIKKENYPAEQFAPTPTSSYAPPPVTPYAQPAQPGMPPTGAAPQQGVRCPNCGNELRPGALYCRSCGAKLR